MKGRLQAKLANKSKVSAPHLLNELYNLNNIPNWDQATFARVSEIVNSIRSNITLFDDIYSIINQIKRYDYELCIAAKGFNNSNYSSQINNLKELYNLLIVKIPSNSHLASSDELLNHSICNKSFIFLDNIRASSKYHLNTTHTFIVDLIIAKKIDFEDAKLLANFYHLNLKKVKVGSESPESGLTNFFDGVPVVLQFIFDEWTNSAVIGKKWLDFFTDNEILELNRDYILENSLYLALRHKPLMLDCVEALIKKDANPHILMRNGAFLGPGNEYYNDIDLLSVAIGIVSLEAVKLLLDYGVRLHISTTSAYLSKLQIQHLFISIHDIGVLDLTKPEGAAYFKDVRILIENAFLDRVFGIAAPKSLYINREAIAEKSKSVTDKSVDENWLGNISTQKKKPNQKKGQKKQKQQQKIAQKVKEGNIELDESKISADEDSELDIKESADSPATLIKCDNQLALVDIEALEAYISYKENIQKEADLSDVEILKHQFDTLLLRNDRDGLTALLNNNPELYGYSVTALFDGNISNDIANDVLSCNPILLHKFYDLKKKSISRDKLAKDTASLGSGVYEVESMFDKKVFIKVSDEIQSQLQLGNCNSKLSKLKIILTKSKGENGIKFYDNAIKLKLAREDESAYATKQYLDKDGNIFIEFDELHNHEWRIKKTAKLEIIKVSSSEFESMIHDDFNHQSAIGHYGKVDICLGWCHDKTDDEITLIGQDG